MELQQRIADQVSGDVEEARGTVTAGRGPQAPRHGVQQRLADAEDGPDARGDVVDPGQVLGVGERLEPGAQRGHERRGIVDEVSRLAAEGHRLRLAVGHERPGALGGGALHGGRRHVRAPSRLESTISGVADRSGSSVNP